MNAISSPKFSNQKSPMPKRPFSWLLLLSLGIVTILLIMVQWEEVDFLDQDEEGNPILSEERQQKLDKALQELEEAEQYALLASKNGYYPCFSCPDSSQIFLYLGEVWRYGITTKGESGRYGNTLSSQYLVYIVQFQGDLTACKKQELLKIYNYAKLPENLKRSRPLIRSPGNKIDQ